MLIKFELHLQKKEAQKKKELLDLVSDARCQAEQNGISATVSEIKMQRLADLAKQIQEINTRKAGALNELEELEKSVLALIESNRGGDTSIHGFIGERAQVSLSNANSIMKGKGKVCVLLDDGSMTDYLENGIAIQQKACRSNGFLGLDHILVHHAKYPEYHGKYHIPKDFYEQYQSLAGLSQKEAGRLRRHEYSIWKKIQLIKKEKLVIEPMRLRYDEIQKDTIGSTIDRSKDEIQAEAQKGMDAVNDAHKPTIKAGCLTTGFSSATEAGMSGLFKALEIKARGKAFKEFDKQDAKEIGVASVEGAVRGAVRGAAVYVVENFTPVPGVIPSAAITVAFESGKAIIKHHNGELTDQECLEAIAKALFISAAGVLGAKIGGKICPIPVVGEILGSLVFTFAADKGYNVVAKIRRSTNDEVVVQIAS